MTKGIVVFSIIFTLFITLAFSTQVFAEAKQIIPSDRTGVMWDIARDVVSTLETFRQKESEYFTVMREASKQRAEDSSIQDVSNLLLPDNIQAPGADIPPVHKDKAKALNYAKFAFASLMVSLFTNQVIFYIVLIILTIFLLSVAFKFI